MSDTPIRDERGRLLPGVILNPAGRPPYETPKGKYNRDRMLTMLDRNGFEPMQEMVQLYRDKDSSNYLRFAICQEIASYVYAKRKTIVLGEEDGSGAEIRISWDTPASTEANAAPPKPDKASKQFDRKMRHAHQTVIDAVLADGDDNGTD